MKNKNTLLIIGVIIILIVVLVIVIQRYKTSNENFPEITMVTGIVGVDVDYNSGIKVSNLEDVKIVFNKFIDYSKVNNKDIFGSPAKNWRYENATIHGMYQGKKYWKVTASRFEDNPEYKAGYNKWWPQEVFDVSEDGEFVRLLGGT